VIHKTNRDGEYLVAVGTLELLLGPSRLAAAAPLAELVQDLTVVLRLSTPLAWAWPT